MYIHIHTYTHRYTHMYMHICLQLNRYTSVHETCLHICTHKFANIRYTHEILMHTYMYTYKLHIACVHIYIYIYTYIWQTHTYTHTHTRTHTHTHTFTRGNPQQLRRALNDPCKSPARFAALRMTALQAVPARTIVAAVSLVCNSALLPRS